MIVSEIATRVRRIFGDDSAVQVTDADIIRWVNDAMREVAASNNLLQVKATSNTAIGQADYTQPTNLMTMHTVRYGGEKLKGVSIQEADELDYDDLSVGTPVYFSNWAGVVTLYPAPETNGVANLVMLYTRTPVDVTLVSETPELPVKYHNRIVDYCLAMAAEMDDNPQAYQNRMGQFRSGVEQLRADVDFTEQDVYPSISVAPADYGSGISAYAD